jgi:hypothetical protein
MSQGRAARGSHIHGPEHQSLLNSQSTRPVELKVTAELVVAGSSLTLEEITKRVGVECDRGWRIGDPRGKTGKSWATNGWVLRSVKSAEKDDASASHLVRSCVGDLFRRLQPIAEKVKGLSGEADIGISIDVLACDVPGLNFDRDVLRVIADAGAWLQINVILWDRSGENHGDQPRPTDSNTKRVN